jgi:hypothetical protein
MTLGNCSDCLHKKGLHFKYYRSVRVMPLRSNRCSKTSEIQRSKLWSYSQVMKLTALPASHFLTALDLSNAKEDSASYFSKESKTFQETMKLIPVSLFNHRLWTMANHEGTDFVDDIDHLAKGFLRELRQHRKDISSIYAKEALRQNPDLENSFTKIGASLKVRKVKQHSRDEELPPYEEDAGESGMKEVGNRFGEMSLQRGGK